MYVNDVEEMILNEESPVYGWRMFRLEYGGHAQDCIVEGHVFIPPEKCDKAYEIMDKITALFQ